MNKSNIISFIERYNLNGVVESVKYTVKDKVLSTSFVSEDKSMAGSVTALAFDFEDAEFGIYETTKFKSFLKVLDDEISLKLNKVDDKPNSLTLADKNMEVSFMLSDLTIIPSAPTVKEVKSFDVEIPIDADFTARFVKAKNALPDVDSFTLLMNKKGDKLELIIGFSSINSNRIKLEVSASTGKDTLAKPISFNANYFRDILSKNADCTGAALKIAEAGIAKIEFGNTDFKTTYYLIKKQIES